MSTTETTGWLTRMGESIKGVLVGLLLIVGSVVLLFKNEGCAVHTAQALAEGEKAAIEVNADSVDSKNEGKLVVVQGEVTTKETLKDPQFGASANALQIKRTVEMYQRTMKTESHKELGGKEVTTYTCDKMDWSSDAIDVSKCKDVQPNPPMQWKSEGEVTNQATLGAFKVPEELAGQVPGGEPLAVTSDTLKEAAPDVASRATVSDGKIYVGKEPSHPAVGDVRVSFAVVKPTTVTIAAEQKSGALEAYKAKNGEPVEILKTDNHSAKELFKMANDDNNTRTWICRFAGWLLMAIGFFLVFKPIETVADVVPFIGSLLGAGLFIFALLLSTMFSSITIAIGWIFYRPLLGLGLLVAGVGAGVLLSMLGKKKQPA